jgi:hypothetical protein
MIISRKSIMKKSLVFAISFLTAGIAMTAAAPASARVNWSVNVGVGGYGYYPPPVVYAPRPYYPPPPVIYAPAPVYGQPIYQQPVYAPPVYVQPAQYYSPPVYIQNQPGPYYVAPPVYRGYQRGYREYPDYYRR